MFFAPNMRGVNSSGIDFVMKTFFDALGDDGYMPVASSMASSPRSDLRRGVAGGVCLLLRPSGRGMTLLLLGDFHGRILSEAAGALDLPLLGGFIGSGRRLNNEFYHPEGEDVRFLDPPLDRTYRAALAQAGVVALGR